MITLTTSLKVQRFRSSKSDSSLIAFRTVSYKPHCMQQHLSKSMLIFPIKCCLYTMRFLPHSSDFLSPPFICPSYSSRFITALFFHSRSYCFNILDNAALPMSSLSILRLPVTLVWPTCLSTTSFHVLTHTLDIKATFGLSQLTGLIDQPILLEEIFSQSWVEYFVNPRQWHH